MQRVLMSVLRDKATSAVDTVLRLVRSILAAMPPNPPYVLMYDGAPLSTGTIS
jgi:hypothetical protein